MHGPLHLIVELNSWAPSGEDPAVRTKLESHLADRPNITLTVVTRGPLQAALERMGPALKLPSQIIAEAGTAIYQAGGPGGWQEDAQYRAWVESNWDPKCLEALMASGVIRGLHLVPGGLTASHAIFEAGEGMDMSLALEALSMNASGAGLKASILAHGNLLELVPSGVDRGTAVAHLRNVPPPKGPLMVCGSSDLNLDLFRTAEFPILMADSPMDFRTPGIPRDRVYRTALAGANGVLEALIRFEFENLFAGEESRS